MSRELFQLTSPDPQNFDAGVRIEDLEKRLKRRLGYEDDKTLPWTLRESSVGGRGVFTTKDMDTGELIFADVPIVKGPRAGLEEALCSNCLQVVRPLLACPSGCRLPVCRGCSDDHPSTPECLYLRRLGPPPADTWSPEIYRALTPFKCLQLSTADRLLIACMQPLSSPQLSLEVKLLKRGLDKDLSQEDESWMDRCCKVLDSVAFETVTGDMVSKSSVRGLFPLAGLMNHRCSPNTRHYCDSEGRLMFVASKPIKKGDELFTSYCPTLWATHVRSRFLFETKQFLCNCQRCSHPTEFETFLSALGCGACGGLIMPESPLNLKSIWKCNKCEKTLTTAQANLAMVVLAQTKNKNNIFLPTFNHIVIEAALMDLLKTSNRIKSLSDDELNQREKTIKTIIEIIDKLSLGECRTRGLLYYELYSTLNENAERKHIVKTSEKESEFYLRSGAKILAEDVSVPHHIQQHLNKIKINAVESL